MTRAAAVVVALLIAVTASAQRPLFDPDDFLDPRTTGGRPVFISHLVIGAASNMAGDGFRPLGENIGYVHFANSFSWRSVQFDYKRSQMKAEDGEAAEWDVFRNEGPVLTRPGTPKSKDTLNAAWYWPVPGGGGVPVMLRSRVTFTTQPIRTDVIDDETQPVSGHERTFALDTDTWFRICAATSSAHSRFPKRRRRPIPPIGWAIGTSAHSPTPIVSRRCRSTEQRS